MNGFNWNGLDDGDFKINGMQVRKDLGLKETVILFLQKALIIGEQWLIHVSCSRKNPVNSYLGSAQNGGRLAQTGVDKMAGMAHLHVANGTGCRKMPVRNGTGCNSRSTDEWTGFGKAPANRN